MEKIKYVLSGLRYCFYLIFHPFKAFWDLKHEKKGNFGAVTVLILLVIVTMIVRRQLTGFLFQTASPKDMNVVIMITSVLLPFFLWCISNWCITTLVDGEGKFLDIVMVSAYALTPLILIQLPATLLSNVIISSESGFYTFFIALSIAWTAFLMIVGIMTVHQFTLGKTVGTILIAVLGMIIIIFLLFLLFALIQQFVNFFILLQKELAMR